MLLILGIVFEAQQNSYEQRLGRDVRESISAVIAKIDFRGLGRQEYLQRLVVLRDQIEQQPHVKYAYALDPNGGLLLALKAPVDSGSTTKNGFAYPWEPVLASTDMAPTFTAKKSLLAALPQRVKPYERLMLLGVPLGCGALAECPEFRVAITTAALAESLERLRVSLLLSALLIPLSTGLVVFFTIRRFLLPLREISESMRGLASQASELSAANEWTPGALPGRADDLNETRFFRESLQQFTAAMNSAAELKNELTTNRSLSDLARQVAHDIRSPLAALDSVVGRLDGLTPDKEKIVQGAVGRIRDIANGLLKNQPTVKASGPVDTPASTEAYLLQRLIGGLLSEKRQQFREKSKVRFLEEYDESSYGIYVGVDAVELARVLSNLINNAVEATASGGWVKIRLQNARDSVLLVIEDNGRGIPQDVLPKVFSQGFSFGKDSGSGLGLYHARNMIESWGGTIQITSKAKLGTSIKIELPLAAPPSWLPSELVLVSGTTLVICDDDQSIHDLWQVRLSGENAGNVAQGIEVRNFKDSESCVLWYRSAQCTNSPKLFLIDFDIRSSELNGEQLIDELGIAGQSWLVTSHSEDRQLQESCEKLGVALLPKELVAIVPIRRLALPKRIDAVLIDDDAWIRDSWTDSLRRAGGSLLACAGRSEFFAAESAIAKTTPIFIDYHLRRDNGGSLGEKLHSLGFSELYVATGSPASDLPPMPWAKAIIGKDVPAWLAKRFG